MGLFDASQSSGGSQNSAYNTSQSVSDSWANTAGAEASATSEQAAERAFQRQKELMQMQMDFNREEAQKARDWEENMANTIYTRSTKNMKEAGINPVLAAGMGLSGASVGSAATANIGGASAPMANTFSEYNSASHSESYGIGESQGSSWNQSTSGFTTALEQIVGMFQSIGNAFASGINVNLNGTMDNLGNMIDRAIYGTDNPNRKGYENGVEYTNKVSNASAAAVKAAKAAVGEAVENYKNTIVNPNKEDWRNQSGKYGDGNGS